MAEQFFTKITNDVLEATEKLSNHFEEGIAAIFAGAGEGGAGAASEETDATAAASGQAGDAFLMDEGLDPEQFKAIEEELRHNPLQGIADSVVGDIMGGQAGPQTPRENFDAFRQAITWSEPFIVALVAFQIVMFLFTLWCSRRDRGIAPRIVLMVTIAGLVRSSEYWNQWASRNFESFATQNYFDERGIFVSVLVCAPLLLDSLLMLFMFLREASQLLIQVKTAELKKKRKGVKGEAAAGTAGGGSKRRSKKDQ